MANFALVTKFYIIPEGIEMDYDLCLGCLRTDIQRFSYVLNGENSNGLDSAMTLLRRVVNCYRRLLFSNTALFTNHAH